MVFDPVSGLLRKRRWWLPMTRDEVETAAVVFIAGLFSGACAWCLLKLFWLCF